MGKKTFNKFCNQYDDCSECSLDKFSNDKNMCIFLFENMYEDPEGNRFIFIRLD